jgi:hypothetical protein
VFKLNKSQIFEIRIEPAQCLSCKHLNRETVRCAAFGKNQIPDDIQLNLHDHRYPFPDDNNIRFEMSPVHFPISNSFFSNYKKRSGLKDSYSLS